MTYEMQTVIQNSISEVIEKMFYTPIDFDNENDIEEAGFLTSTDKILATKLLYEGEKKGYFVFIIPEELLINLTTNFLGEPPENIMDKHIDGMIKEILNMIAGNVFSSMIPHLDCCLKIPELIDFKEGLSLISDSSESHLVLAETPEGFMAVIHVSGD